MADILQFIKDIKPELKEKLIYRRYIQQKSTAKKAQGWDEVHKSINSAPYCERNQQIVNILFCPDCMHRAEIYRCELCHRKTKDHYIIHPGFNNNDYDECFIRIYPYDLSWCDKLREIYINHELEEHPIENKNGRYIRINKNTSNRTPRTDPERVHKNKTQRERVFRLG